MATPGSSLTPTPLGHEGNLEVWRHPRANALQHKTKPHNIRWANQRIARHMGRSEAAIKRIKQQWVDNGRFQSQDSSSRPRVTADREDR
ncbi:hypothetical protein TNCV_3195191 [Trichonephila clavipes]|uniref:Uncharacterized protein n=1 Tax=Trichonephila clavipes TaxID=2585209 RepID=A0A8X6R949_TRICX|nr:hypothetical protein TNCV_3195191 [Trichonephila clavipes]